MSRQAQISQREDRALIGRLMDKVVEMENEHPKAVAQALRGVADLTRVTENLMYVAQARYDRQSEPSFDDTMAHKSQE